MAYGDATLDQIMLDMRGAEGAPRPQGRITQTSSFGLPPVEAPAVPAPAQPGGLGYRLGRFAGRIAKGIPGVAGVSEAISGLGEAATDGPTLGSAIRTGVGVSSLYSPQARLVATGMGVADLAGSLAKPFIDNAAAAAGDVRGPATKEFMARGGMKPFSAVAAPGDTGRDDTLIDATAGTIPAPAPIAGPDNNIIPPRGTGFIRNNTTGAVTQIDSRVPGGAPAAAPVQSPGFTGALLRLKQISGDNAQKVANAKAQSAALAAEGTYARGAAALSTSRASVAAASEYLKANPGDYAGYTRVLHGREGTGGGDNVFFPGLGPNDPTTVGNKRTGAVISRRPQVEAQMGKDAKGTWQILSPDGKTAVRPATPEEIARRNAGR